MNVSPDGPGNIRRELTVSGDISTLLVTALDQINDAVHLFRVDDTGKYTRLYQNRAAAAAPSVSCAEIREALAADGAVLRAGTSRDSVCEMRARRFTSFQGRFAVAIERDVTERDRVERAYDDAAFRAQLRADRYARLCRLAAESWPLLRQRSSAILEFALRETQMGRALLIRQLGSNVRTWSASGDPQLQIDIPDSFVRAAPAPGSSRVVVPWPDTPTSARFSICCVSLWTGERVLLALGRAVAPPGPAVGEAPRFVGEFLSLCASLAASGDSDDADPS